MFLQLHLSLLDRWWVYVLSAFNHPPNTGDRKMNRYKNQARKQSPNQLNRVVSLEKLDRRDLFAGDLGMPELADLNYGPQIPSFYGPIQASASMVEASDSNQRTQVADLDRFFATTGLIAEGEARSGTLTNSQLFGGVRDDHSNLRNRTATSIRLNSAGYAQLPGRIEILRDRDVFQLDLTSTQTVTFKVIATSGSLDTFLRIYNSRGQLIASDDDSGEGTNSQSTVSLTSGKYYVEVSALADRSGGNYNLQVQGTPSDDHSNALNATATNILLSGSGRAFVYGNLENNRDVDVFRFDVASSRLVTIDVAQNGANTLDSYLRLYNSRGQVVAFNDDGGIGSNSRLSVNLTSGRYYIQVTSYNSASMGRYSVSVVTGSPSTGSSNQGSSETLRFSGSGRVSETDSTTNSVKQYQMTAPSTRSYRLQIRGLSLRSGTFEIRNTRGDLIASGALNSRSPTNIRFNMIAGQGYFMTVRGASGSNGSFSLSIQ